MLFAVGYEVPHGDAPLGSILTGQNGRKPAKGGAFPLLVESTPLSWAVRSCFPDRAEGRAPYQEETRPLSSHSLLGWCAVLLFSALPVAHPGRRRPGEAAFPRPEALVEGAGTASGVEIAQRCVQPSNRPHQAQGRLGPQPGTKHKNMGFPKGSPFGGSLVTFCPSESHPSGASPLGRRFAPEKWLEARPSPPALRAATPLRTREMFVLLFRTLRTLKFPERWSTIPQLA